MKKLIIPLLSLLILSGCDSLTDKTKYKVACSNGFSTGWYDFVTVDHGEIRWRNKSSDANKVHFLPRVDGITCTREKKVVEYYD